MTFNNVFEVRLKNGTVHQIPSGYFLVLCDHLVCHSSSAGRACGHRVPVPKAPFEPVPRSQVDAIIGKRRGGAKFYLWEARP